MRLERSRSIRNSSRGRLRVSVVSVFSTKAAASEADIQEYLLRSSGILFAGFCFHPTKKKDFPSGVYQTLVSGKTWRKVLSAVLNVSCLTPSRNVQRIIA